MPLVCSAAFSLWSRRHRGAPRAVAVCTDREPRRAPGPGVRRHSTGGRFLGSRTTTSPAFRRARRRASRICRCGRLPTRGSWGCRRSGCRSCRSRADKSLAIRSENPARGRASGGRRAQPRQRSRAALPGRARYPHEALMNRLEGWVEIRVHHRGGRRREGRRRRGCAAGSRVRARRPARAIARWKFQPVVVGGVVVERSGATDHPNSLSDQAGCEDATAHTARRSGK